MGTTTVAQKTRKPRARLVFISILIAVASIITPLTATTPAYADTQSDIHDINYKYYAARYLRDCLAQLPGNQKGLIRQAALDQHVFLNPAQSNTKVSIGRYLEPDDGLAGCEETNLIQTAMASLGYGDDPGKLLTDIGYRKIDCTSPDNATYDAAVCTRADVRQVKQVVYERVNDRDTMNASIVDKLTQPPYARYVAYRGIFTQHCQLVEPPTGNGSAVTYKKVVQDSDGTYKAEDTKAEFVIREVTNNGNTAI